MKIKTKITALLASLTFLASCKESEEYGYHHTVGEENNAITLMAGISEGGAKLQTRAVDGNHAAGTNGGGHTLITTGAKMLLDVRGKWKKTSDGSADPIAQTTTITIGGASATEGNGKLHNAITTYDPQLYWDDYGTADPNNATAGRAEGLTIYGVGVNNATENAPTVSNWTAFTWELPTNQSTATNNVADWTKKDLLTSNNIRPTTNGGDGTLVFDHTKTGSTTTPSNILEFTHAMSMVTVVLTAREGFDGWSTSNQDGGKFTGAPSVTLKDFKYKGKVNIESKISTPDDGDAAKSDINMHLASGGANNHTATFDAIVFPGNSFDDDTEILTLTADGNTFKVKAKELNTAIQSAIDATATTKYPTDQQKKLVQGWNYKIQITVDKTKIQVLATVVDWENVTANPAYPKISVTDSYGIGMGTGTEEERAFEKDFDFFRSTSINQNYSNDAWIEYKKVDSKDTYTMHDQLYWPSHEIHYFFRGVWPRVGTDDQTEINQTYTKKANVDDKDIDVQNVAYTENTFPSDLMIGYPRVAADKTCPHGNKVEENGICATEGSVIMNFRYVMSQVEVILETTLTDDKVKIDANTTVEIVNGYTGGSIKLENGSSVGSTKGTYSMNQESYTSETSTEPAKATFHDAILPQGLTLDSKDLLFRITINNGDGTKDVYECPIKDIYVPTGSTTKINAWEAGKRYVYTLTLKKTEIKVTATITPWTEVTANQPVWF